MHDMLGLFSGLKPKFVKRYAELGDLAVSAVQQYTQEVRDCSFPGTEHCYDDTNGKGKVKNTGLVSDGPAVNHEEAQGYLGGLDTSGSDPAQVKTKNAGKGED